MIFYSAFCSPAASERLVTYRYRSHISHNGLKPVTFRYPNPRFSYIYGPLMLAARLCSPNGQNRSTQLILLYSCHYILVCNQPVFNCLKFQIRTIRTMTQVVRTFRWSLTASIRLLARSHDDSKNTFLSFEYVCINIGQNSFVVLKA